MGAPARSRFNDHTPLINLNFASPRLGVVVPKQGTLTGTALAHLFGRSCACLERPKLSSTACAKYVKQSVSRTKIGWPSLRGVGTVLTLRCRLRSISHLAAALVLSGSTVFAICGAARAEGSGIGGCIGSWDTLNCVVRWGPIGDPYVRQVPERTSDTERGFSTDRERRWEQHCRPQIALDRYGVPRYLYAAPGCELGAY
jgi:hypothetical protein